MICPEDDPNVVYACHALYCPPNIDSNKPGNFSVSVCTMHMMKIDNSTSNLEKGTVICEYTPQMCNYSCDYLLKNISSLPSQFPKKKLIGDAVENSMQTKMYVGCVPGNFSGRGNDFKAMSELSNPPSLTSNSNQLANSLFLPLLFTFILLIKMKVL